MAEGELVCETGWEVIVIRRRWPTITLAVAELEVWASGKWGKGSFPCGEASSKEWVRGFAPVRSF